MSSAKKMQQQPAMMRIVVAALVMAMLVTEVISAGECNCVDKLCEKGFCCSEYGYCGTTADYCEPGKCQCGCWPASPPPPPPPPSPPCPPSKPGVADIITEEFFEKMLPYRNDGRCHAVGFYTYSAFITAAKDFPCFGTTGDLETRKRELAAFFGQTSHETTGGTPGAKDRHEWGYCWKEENGGNVASDYCDKNSGWPCAEGKKYYGRGPIQLSWNYNYGQAGQALGEDLINDPELVASDAVVSFRTAIWFWMTPQSPKPSCHDVIIDNWTPTDRDIAAGRLPGYGVITNIINGGIECGNGPNESQKDRIGYYKRYCEMLGVSYGDNLDCDNQCPFNQCPSLSLPNKVLPASTTAVL